MASQIDPLDLEAIDRRSKATSGVRWEAVLHNGMPLVRVTFRDGTHDYMRLSRDSQPASAADFEFVAAARRDIERLVGALRSGEPVSDEDLDAIEVRSRGASPGPWRPFLRSDGGLGGTNVIWVSDSDREADLYLWLGRNLAPDADFEFVGTARQDIPRLLAAFDR